MSVDPVRLTQDLVRCKSVTPADDGAQDVMIAPLKDMGFEVHRMRFGVIENFFAVTGEKGAGKHFCYAGHTDVVPAADESLWTYPPFDAVIENGILYGRGTADMKANNACFVAAVSRFIEKHGRPEGQISLLITGDEEAEAIYGTVKVLKWMDENGFIPDATLVGEPSNPDALGDEIKVGRRGSLTGRLSVKGRQGHVAYPALADNPLPKIIALAQVLSDYTFDEGNEFFPATNLELTTIDTGNTADNVIPNAAKAQFNVRFNNIWTAETLEQKIREIMDETGIEYDLQCSSNAESFLTDNKELCALIVDSVEDITGRRPEMTTKGGTSDARFIAKYGPVVECGLVNKTIHQTDEHVSLRDIEDLTQIYFRVLERYFNT